MSHPSISVLLTYHNEASLLTDTLQSLCAGADRPDEVLIYDDASSIQPGNFVPERLPVRVIRGEKNVGPGAGRNILLNAAAGDYVHFHDSDDWFHPEWGQIVRGHLAGGDVDVLYTEITSSATGTPVFEQPIMDFDRLGLAGDLTAYAIEHAILVPSATIRRQCALKIGGFRVGLSQSEDKDFYIRLNASGIRPAIETRPLICIRNRPDSRSKRQVEVWLDGLRCLEHARQELPGRYQKSIANAAARCATQLLRLNQTEAARKALNLAEELGGADYHWRSSGFKWMAHLMGARCAERLSSRYQQVKGTF